MGGDRGSDSADWTPLATAVAAAVAAAADQHPEATVAVAARRIGTDDGWARDAAPPLPAASTIKLAVLLAVARAIDTGRLTQTDLVPLTAGAKVPGSGVLTALHDGLPLTVGDLAYLMVAISDNTASNLLLDAVGTDAVAAVAADLGLGATALRRRFLGRAPGPGDPENVTSAADLAALLAAVAEDRAASPDGCAWVRDLLGRQQHRDRLARDLPPGVDFAGKSGSLPGLAHDAGLLTGPRGTVAVAVLTRGLPDPYAADAAIGAIGRAAAGAIA